MEVSLRNSSILATLRKLENDNEEEKQIVENFKQTGWIS